MCSVRVTATNAKCVNIDKNSEASEYSMNVCEVFAAYVMYRLGCGVCRVYNSIHIREPKIFEVLGLELHAGHKCG